MNDNYYTAIDAALGSWHVTNLIGEGSFGKVYEIERNEKLFGKDFKSALKVISIPQTRGEIDSLKSEGMTDEGVTDYFKGIVNEVLNEYDFMAKLKGNNNVVNCEELKVIKHREEIGWDILIRMELLNPLVKRLRSSEMSKKEIIKLGIDMCNAVENCQKFNIIHRDIKPENIFISDTGEYKLGDFGVARTVEKTSSGMSRKGTYTYMAPEIYNVSPYGSTVDIYSIGLVMYKLLNKNRAPFYPEHPAQITNSDKEKALMRRMRGEMLPPPVCADKELASIVMKACAYNPYERYQTPALMRQDLERLYMQEDIQESFANDMTEIANDSFTRRTNYDGAESTAVTSYEEEDTEKMSRYEEEPTAENTDVIKKEKRNKVALRIGILLSALGVVAIAFIIFFLMKYSNKTSEADIIKEAKEYYKGINNHERNRDKAEELLAEVENDEDGEAAFLLGQIAEEKEEYEEAVVYYEKSIKKKNAEAMRYMGDLYYNGQGVDRDYNKAYELYCEAADAGNPDGMYCIASMIEHGNSDTLYDMKLISTENATDETKLMVAFIWYEKAADAGSAEAMYYIGDMYEEGHGVAKDQEKANEWYRRAEEAE